MKSQILDWDSTFFGFRVAKIDLTDFQEDYLKTKLNQLKTEAIQLVYLATNKPIEASQLIGIGAKLVDLKTTYWVDLSILENNTGTEDVVEWQTHHGNLEDLALQSGEYSRFKVDPRFPIEKFRDLYLAWIRKSLSKEYATDVFVICENGKAIGFVTLNEQKDYGEIGLIAVDSNFRGRRIGQRLVRVAQKIMLQKGYSRMQVVTQGDNIPACQLYEKCGFAVLKQEWFYHIWV